DPDVDSQLIIKITFREMVKIKSFKLQSNNNSTSVDEKSSVTVTDATNEEEHESSAPKHVKLFVNRANLNFADAEHEIPTEDFVLTKSQTDNGEEIKVKFVKYQA